MHTNTHVQVTKSKEEEVVDAGLELLAWLVAERAEVPHSPHLLWVQIFDVLCVMMLAECWCCQLCPSL